MPSCPDPTISTRNLGLFADLQVTEVTNKITPRYCGEAKSQSPKGPSPSQRLTSPSLARAIVVDFGTSENGDFARCKSVQKEEKTSLAWWLPRTWGTTVHVAGRSMKIQAAMCQLSQSRAPSGPIGPHRLKKSSLCRFLCNDSFVTSLYAGPFARYPTLSRSNCGEGMVKSPSVSSAPQNEHMTKQHKPDVGSGDSQLLNA